MLEFCQDSSEEDKLQCLGDKVFEVQDMMTGAFRAQLNKVAMANLKGRMEGLNMLHSLNITPIHLIGTR